MLPLDNMNGSGPELRALFEIACRHFKFQAQIVRPAKGCESEATSEAMRVFRRDCQPQGDLTDQLSTVPRFPPDL